jgi:hypothetical protein
MDQITMLIAETNHWTPSAFLLTSLGGVVAGLLALLVEHVFGSRRR